MLSGGKAVNGLLRGIVSRGYTDISQAMAKVLSFTEITEKLSSPGTVLLDVREKGELTTDGKISGSRNIPVGEFAAAMNMKDQDFESKYGFKKPYPSDDIVIHCKAGVRAQNAAKVLMSSGYVNVQVYPGIKDWIENGGKVEK